MIYVVLYLIGAYFFSTIIQREVEDADYWGSMEEHQRLKLLVLGALLTTVWIFAFPAMIIKEWFEEEREEEEEEEDNNKEDKA